MAAGHHCGGAVVLGEVAEGDDGRDSSAFSGVLDRDIVGMQRLFAEAGLRTA
ncbi:MAG: hypothetical protein H0U41_06805 [Actinobacteria bacterium]|nr:hypothetical protein [Actinomycetota bacterium]